MTNQKAFREQLCGHRDFPQEMDLLVCDKQFFWQVMPYISIEIYSHLD
jgi:hypothetical protein